MPRITSITSQQLAGISILKRDPPQLLYTISNPNGFDTPVEDGFGTSVDISGNRAIVGAPLEDDANGNSSGKAYIIDTTTGSLVHTLDNPNPFGTSAGDIFGDSVAISGNRAIVGAYAEGDAGGTNSGKAYIFNVTTGNLVHTLDNPNAYDTSAGDFFGESVAISGNRAIVAAPFEDDAGGSSSGKAYIFDVTTGNLVHTLDNPNAYNTSTFDNFAASVAISGNYAIVGAWREDDAGGTGSGKAYIFDVTTGNLLHTLDNPNAYDTSANDNFGWSVAISGTNVIVGAPNEDSDGGSFIINNTGRAYIFDAISGNLVHTLTTPTQFDTFTVGKFGGSVAISGNYAAVGSPDTRRQFGATGVFSVGIVQIFNVTTGARVHTIDHPRSAALEQFYAPGESVVQEKFGQCVALHENLLIAGIPGESGQTGDYTIDIGGFAHIYELQEENPLPVTGGGWLDDNGDPVTVASIISPIAMQVNGVFAQNPTVPFDIQGVTSGATTTVTNIAANTGTLLELDDNGNSTSFTVGEQLNIV